MRSGSPAALRSAASSPTSLASMHVSIIVHPILQTARSRFSQGDCYFRERRRRRAADGVAATQRFCAHSRMRAHRAVQRDDPDARARHVFSVAQTPPRAWVHRLRFRRENKPSSCATSASGCARVASNIARTSSRGWRTRPHPSLACCRVRTSARHGENGYAEHRRSCRPPNMQSP